MHYSLKLLVKHSQIYSFLELVGPLFSKVVVTSADFHSSGHSLLFTVLLNKLLSNYVHWILKLLVASFLNVVASLTLRSFISSSMSELLFLFKENDSVTVSLLLINIMLG